MLNTEFTQQIPDIIQELGELEDDLQHKAMSSGLTASAKPLKDRLKQNAPSESGALKSSIGQVQLSRTAKTRLGIAEDQRAILVGPVRKVLTTSRMVLLSSGKREGISSVDIVGISDTSTRVAVKKKLRHRRGHRRGQVPFLAFLFFGL